MKKLLNLILLLLISSTIINAQQGKIGKAMADFADLIRKKSAQITESVSKASDFKKTFGIMVPLSAITGYLGYRLIKSGCADKNLANNMVNDPRANIQAIEDFCLNYKEAIHTRKDVIFKRDSSLYLMYMDASKDDEKLKLLSKYVKNLMYEQANGKIFAGVIIPLFVLGFSSVAIYESNK